MKYNTANLTAPVASMASVQAAPSSGIQARGYTVGNPFVDCMRKSFPNFPREGKPSKEQLRACVPKYQPHDARELEPLGTRENSDSLQSRDFGILDVLGKKLGLDQKSQCMDEKDTDTKLDDEFVWPEDVVSAGGGVCDEAMKIIEETGLDEDGGVAYANKKLSNTFDDRANTLKKGRELLVTMSIDYIPPLAAGRDEIQKIAKGVRFLCSSAVVRLMDGRDGCTERVNWYVSQKAKSVDHLAAKVENSACSSTVPTTRSLQRDWTFQRTPIRVRNEATVIETHCAGSRGQTWCSRLLGGRVYDLTR